MSGPPGRVKLVGLGNRYRRDDAAGIVAAERLRDIAPAMASVVALEGEPIDLLEAWRGADTAVVIDAMRSGATPGTVRRVDAGREPLASATPGDSTHALGLGEAIELARALGRLPRRLVVVGIEVQRSDAGEGLTDAVATAIEEAVRLALEEAASAAGA